MRRGRALVGVACCAVLAAACGSSGPVNSATTATPSASSGEVSGNPLVIRTADGLVRGLSTASTRQFLGIPFARPPTGSLRWQAPEPPKAWTSTFAAVNAGPECPQIVPVVNAFAGSENCLHLNVFAPKSPSTKLLPVMVWIYGGGFTVGSSTDDSPANFAASDNTVTVSFNYRLGPLGFLALPALANESPIRSTGDLGLLDQQAALRWVQANVAAFGGNPRNVTIFGESAGGMSVCAQLLSPLSKGLFEKGITESGPCTLPSLPVGFAESEGARLASTLGCPTGAQMLPCMRSKPAKQIIEAMPPDPSFVFGSGAAWDPVADGVVLPANPIAALDAGRFHHVPMIVGANRDEGRLFVALHDNAVGKNLADARWASAVNGYFGATLGPKVQRQYPLAAYPDAGAALGQAIGDATLACPAVASAQILRKYVPVYEYEYTQTPNPFILPTPGIVLGAFHSSELPYVFDGPVLSSGHFTFTPAQQRLATAISGAWARFAATGDPSGGGLSWPRLRSAEGRYLVLNTPTAVKTGMKQKHCAFWAKSGWTIANVIVK